MFFLSSFFFWFAAVYIFVFVLDAGGFITWTQLPTLAFSCYIIRAGRYKEGQLEELLAVGINVDAAPSTAELLQLAYAQNFANHFEFLSFILCFYLFLFFFFGLLCVFGTEYVCFFSSSLSCCCFPVFLFYFVSHRHNNNNKYIYVDFGCLFQLLFLCFFFFIVLIYCALQFACLVYSSCEQRRSSSSAALEFNLQHIEIYQFTFYIVLLFLLNFN